MFHKRIMKRDLRFRDVPRTTRNNGRIRTNRYGRNINESFEDEDYISDIIDFVIEYYEEDYCEEARKTGEFLATLLVIKDVKGAYPEYKYPEIPEAFELAKKVTEDMASAYSDSKYEDEVFTRALAGHIVEMLDDEIDNIFERFYLKTPNMLKNH